MNHIQRIIKNIAATAFLVPTLVYSMDQVPSKRFSVESASIDIHRPESLEGLTLTSDYQGQQAEGFQRLRNLKRLTFSFCNLGDKWNEVFCFLPESLEQLTLIKTDYEGQQSEGFQRLRNLKILNIKFCQLGDGWDRIIPFLPESLEQLSLEFTDYAGQEAEAFQRLRNLKYLYFIFSRLGVRGKELLPFLPESLEVLGFEDESYKGQQLQDICEAGGRKGRNRSFCNIS